MENAFWYSPKDMPKDTPILALLELTEEIRFCMVVEWHEHNPKGNPWRVPCLNAWFGEDMLKGWMYLPEIPPK
jgi:hypothetical protein